MHLKNYKSYDNTKSNFSLLNKLNFKNRKKRTIIHFYIPYYNML